MVVLRTIEPVALVLGCDRERAISFTWVSKAPGDDDKIPFTHALTLPLAHPPTRSPAHSLTYSLARSQVEYSASGFLAKNNESLTNDLAALALTTTSPFLAAIFESGRNSSGAGGSGGTGKSSSDISRAAEPPALQHSASGGGGGRGGASSSSGGGGASTKLLGSDTVSLTFRGQMSKLQEILETTSSHFLRCVKPNARQLAADPGLAAAGARGGALGVNNSSSSSSSSSNQRVFGSFDGPMVLEQLNYLGVLETIRIRQVRYGIRIGNMVR